MSTSSKMTHDGLRDIDGPLARQIHKLPAHYGGVSRDGIYFRKKELEIWILSGGWALATEVGFMNIIKELESQFESAKSLWDRYKDRSDQFRGTVKNDIASLEASAHKTTASTEKMMRAYSGVIEKLNSQEMATAIANAERLAVAMEALSKLQSHKLVLAVSDESNRQE